MLGLVPEELQLGNVLVNGDALPPGNGLLGVRGPYRGEVLVNGLDLLIDGVDDLKPFHGVGGRVLKGLDPVRPGSVSTALGNAREDDRGDEGRAEGLLCGVPCPLISNARAVPEFRLGCGGRHFHAGFRPDNRADAAHGLLEVRPKELDQALAQGGLCRGREGRPELERRTLDEVCHKLEPALCDSRAHGHLFEVLKGDGGPGV